MKKNILLFLLPLLFLTSAQAQPWSNIASCCGKNFYGKFLTGVNFLQDTSINGNTANYNQGYIIGGSLGYCWRYGLSLEAEYAFRRNAIGQINFFGQGSSNNGHYLASSFMANVIWEVPSLKMCTFGNTQPFIGAGIGYDLQQMHSSNSLIVFHQTWNHFSWQLMAGFIYPIFCNTEMTLEYKFHQGNTHFYNHTIGIGLIYRFR